MPDMKLSLSRTIEPSEKAVDRIQELTQKTVAFYQTDICDLEGLNKVFDAQQIDAVIHFAGLKAVGESVRKPVEYYNNNIAGTLNLIKSKQCVAHNVKTSSSLLVYSVLAIHKYS